MSVIGKLMITTAISTALNADSIAASTAAHYGGGGDDLQFKPLILASLFCLADIELSYQYGGFQFAFLCCSNVVYHTLVSIILLPLIGHTVCAPVFYKAQSCVADHCELYQVTFN